MNKQKRIIVGCVIGAIVLLVLGIAGVLMYHYSNSVHKEDNEALIDVAKQYVLQEETDAEIIRYSELVKKEDMGVIAILVEYKEDGQSHACCVYFSEHRWLKNRYCVEGANGTLIGEIIADSQYVGENVVIFIRGVGIEENVGTFRIDEIDYTGVVTDEMYLDILLQDEFENITESPTAFDVEVNK